MADPSFVGVTGHPGAGAVEIGYTVLPTRRGQGLAAEAVAALTEWAFATGQVAAAVATVLRENDASLRVLEQVGGFRPVGTYEDERGRQELVFVLSAEEGAADVGDADLEPLERA